MSTTFLPEDYLAQKADKRTNIISLVLFVIVMLSVWFAFLWGNRRTKVVKTEEETITAQFVRAEAEIENLKKLEAQQEDMLDKAELAAALVERVRRSNLLAEIINRMPPRMSMLKFELRSTELKEPTSTIADGAVGKLNKPGGPARMKTRDEIKNELQKVTAPKYMVDVTLVGVTTTDIEVSSFMSALNSFELLSTVRLDYSEEQDIEGRTMRQFKIDMSIANSADVRLTRPTTIKKNMTDPMSEELRFVQPNTTTTPARPAVKSTSEED